MNRLGDPNHILTHRTDEEIAESVNVNFPVFLRKFDQRINTLTTGKGYLKPFADTLEEKLREACLCDNATRQFS